MASIPGLYGQIQVSALDGKRGKDSVMGYIDYVAFVAGDDFADPRQFSRHIGAFYSHSNKSSVSRQATEHHKGQDSLINVSAADNYPYLFVGKAMRVIAM